MSAETTGLKQARFMQEKVESYYEVVYNTLWPWRDIFRLIQEVLTWKKPIFSVALFIGVHWAFYHIAIQDLGAVSLFLTAAIFVVVGDAFWKLATAKDGSRRKRPVPKTTSSFNRVDYVPFESALIATHTSALGELWPFSFLCVIIAKVLAWADMTSVAMTTKVRESPSLFASGLIGLGVIFFVVGTVIPPIVLAYLIAMCCLCWPCVECYQMGDWARRKVGPWLQKIDLQGVKTTIFREETEGEYDFAIDDSMTADAFSRALGARTVSRSSSKTRVAVAMPTIRELSPPPHEAPAQPSEEDLLADQLSDSLDPHYDSLIADLAYGMDDMPSLSSDLGPLAEEEGEQGDFPDVGEPGHTSRPPVSASSSRSNQGRVKRRKLPKRPPIPSHSGWGGGVTSPLTVSVSHQPGDDFVTPPTAVAAADQDVMWGGAHSTPLLSSDPPPSYDEVLSYQGTEDYAGFYRGGAAKED